MELYLNTTSPFARLVRIFLMEKGLGKAVTLRWCDPWADDADLLEVNPAGRIPALVTDDGTTLSESLLIAAYLEAIDSSTALIPPARLSQVLHQAGLGQNLMDAAFATVIARKHHGQTADESILGQRRWRAMQRILVRLEAESPGGPAAPALTLGEISVAVALDYLAFRLAEIPWQNHYPRLATWHREITSRSSFMETAFA